MQSHHYFMLLTTALGVGVGQVIHGSSCIISGKMLYQAIHLLSIGFP